MGGNMIRHWSDSAAELCGGMALGLGAGGAAVLLAPRFGLTVWSVSAGAAVVGWALGWLIVRMVPAERPAKLMRPFALVPLDTVETDEALLLDDALSEPKEDSRVVRLFAPDGPKTVGALQARIDQHLGQRAAETQSPSQAPDASDALHAALDEIRRSLRR